MKEIITYAILHLDDKGKLSDVSYVGYLPFGVDGTYQIKYGTEKALPFFVCSAKRK